MHCYKWISSTLILVATSGFAAAQSHERSEGGYTLRSSTVSSLMLDPATAKAHGIDRAADTAVLNVVVLRDGGSDTVAADVAAEARSLTGRQERIYLRKTTAQGRVSYVGPYKFVPGEVLDFRVSAKPGTEPGLEISLTYRDRMWK